MENKQIYLRYLDTVIQPDNYTAPIDLSDVVLQRVKQVDQGESDIGLGASRVFGWDSGRLRRKA